MEIKKLLTKLSNGAFIGNVDTVKEVVDEFLGFKTEKDQNNNLYAYKDFGKENFAEWLNEKGVKK